jgi:hypothetical protein
MKNLIRFGIPLACLCATSLTPALAAPVSPLTAEEGAAYQNEFVPAEKLPWFAELPPSDLDLSIRSGRALNANLTALLEKLARVSPEIPQAALKRALQYYQDNPTIATNRDFVTVIDFDQASTVKRMHVIDMRAEKATALYAAHGENSGQLYATKFSNVEDTHMSSLGIYVTGEEYQGKNGRSMRLYGMESTNSNAYKRAIVLHGANYVSKEFITKNGRLGLSWGCPAIEHGLVDRMVRDLQEGSVMIAYRSS